MLPSPTYTIHSKLTGLVLPLILRFGFESILGVIFTSHYRCNGYCPDFGYSAGSCMGDTTRWLAICVDGMLGQKFLWSEPCGVTTDISRPSSLCNCITSASAPMAHFPTNSNSRLIFSSGGIILDSKGKHF